MLYRLGIVLSGGGTRGLAHVGVLRALGERGIFPDCVSGTSAGALVGALCAYGHDWDTMLEFFATTSPFRLSKFAVRKPGFLDTEKVVPDFLPYFPDDSFDVLKRKLFVTATDLVAGRPEVFASGPLVRAVIASSSMPPVFTPTRVGDRLFIDGGVIDNFPVSPLLGLCETILGVHVSPLRQVESAAFGNSLVIAQRALEIGMYYSSKRHFHQCDLMIRPEGLAGYGLFDVKLRREIHDRGYAAAVARLPEIEALLGS
jgi:NTE family protein